VVEEGEEEEEPSQRMMGAELVPMVPLSLALLRLALRVAEPPVAIPVAIPVTLPVLPLPREESCYPPEPAPSPRVTADSWPDSSSNRYGMRRK